MNIFCEECGRNIASVFLTRVSQNEVVKIQLCEECVRSMEGMVGAAESMIAVPQLIMEYVNALAESHEDVEEFEEELLSCERCGTSSSDFRKMGLLGCQECYKVFGENLEKLVSEAERGIGHRGKMPRKASEKARLRKRLFDLEMDLAKQVAEERYESAAVVRDQIKEIQERLACCEQRGDSKDG